MATTHTITAKRRVAVGISSAAQGADGVGELTRTAYAALLSASWTDSDAAPSIPVHDYAQPLPSGDAWKVCYGYDATARTERAACGAVCYSYAIPADALTGDPCNIVSVSALVTGDRYLDAGVDCHVVLSSSATPPTVATLAARTPDATLCATGSQTEPPNKRAGIAAELSVEPGAAATAYVHVALLLHDYLGVRGAWIEGGAMLASAAAGGVNAFGIPAVAVEFSRDVAADSTSAVLGEISANIGVFDANLEEALFLVPFASIASTFDINISSDVYADLSDNYWTTVSNNILLQMWSGYPFPLMPDTARGPSTAEYKFSMYCRPRLARMAVERSHVSCCAFVFHAKTDKAKIVALRFPDPISTNIPFRAVLFGISGPQHLTLNADGCYTESLIPSPKTILDEDFLDGGALSVLHHSGVIGSDDGTGFEITNFDSTSSVPGRTLAKLDCMNGTLSRIDFDSPFASGAVSSFLLALVPNGAPLGTSLASSTTAAVSISFATRYQIINMATHRQSINGTWKYFFSDFSSTVSSRYYNVEIIYSCHASVTIDGKTHYASFEAPISLAEGVPQFSCDLQFYTFGGDSTPDTQRATATIKTAATLERIVFEADDGSKIFVAFTIPAASILETFYAIARFGSINGFLLAQDGTIVSRSLSVTGTILENGLDASITPDPPILEIG